MTTFVDVAAIRRIIKRAGIENFMAGMADAVREDFARWQDFDKCARVANHSDIGVIELMPIADDQQYAFKYVNGHPSNTDKGVSTVMAFGALADVETGFPKLVSELTLTTAFRTAATSAVAAKALARVDSKVLGMIGCGAQSEFQAIAFHTLLGVEEVRIFDIDRNAMSRLERHLQSFGNLRVVPAESAVAAVRGADIVTTCTADKTWATILTPDMIEPGMHINAIGGDCPGKTELHADVLMQSKIFVEYEPQTRIEGDIQQLPATHPVHDLWRVIAGLETGRDSNEQVTVFDSVGFAMEDFSALRYVLQLANAYGEGEKIALIPEMDDAKDLFGQLEMNENNIAARHAA
ncbi:MAG: ornithine cyclodeaminase [Woeseiaceae bacterium]|nr:ornithine cyclodeaminase [Woeseiaceae bacterium]